MTNLRQRERITKWFAEMCLFFCTRILFYLSYRKYENLAGNYKFSLAREEISNCRRLASFFILFDVGGVGVVVVGGKIF